VTGRDDEARARQAREEAEWREIVANFGEAPEFPDLPPPPPAPLPPVDEPVAEESSYDDEEGYVPPPPPPVKPPTGLRLVAWLGLFGVPAVVLVCIVFGISLPSLVGVGFVVWFVGGFGYLVATMNGPRDPDGGWDDGAVI
jgi:hypothetical protein